MSLDSRLIETQLRRYAVLYFLLGLIEKELRKRVVITLSSLASEKGYSMWLSMIPQTEMLKRNIQKALRRNGNRTEGVEEYLLAVISFLSGSQPCIWCIHR